MDEYKKNEYELGFESGIKRMAARLRNYILSNTDSSGVAVIKIRDVEAIKRKLLKEEKAENNG